MNLLGASGPGGSSGLLIDTNLLVLYTVGTVNPRRIENFKRTCQYTEQDYRLLLRVIQNINPLYTVAHVMAEVSNLIDLSGSERLSARRVLKEMLSILEEPEMPSARAAQSSPYENHTLADAAVAAVAREHKCTVLTADLDLYLALDRLGVPAINFYHLQAREWGL